MVMNDLTPPTDDKPEQDEARFAPSEEEETLATEDDEETFFPPTLTDEVTLPELDTLGDDIAALADSLAETFDTLPDVPPPVEHTPRRSWRRRNDPLPEAEPPNYDDEMLPDMDVEGALGAVEGLGDIVEERETEARIQQAEQERITEIIANPMQTPQMWTLQRGNLAAWLPGVVLITFGVWLTFRYTTDAPLPPSLVSAGFVAWLALAFLLAWMTSGRWNRGTLFLALWGLLSAGALTLTQNVATLGGNQIPALLLIAFGGAFVLSGLLARPFSMVTVFPGLVLWVIGGVWLAASLGLLSAQVIALVGVSGWLPVVILGGLIMLLPVFASLRR
jgi:hypothetical protein